ncbi:hypothetical protein GCM10018980_02710 [Streptomyces capoamus]|uniref:Uncharacterized protein n=1 Tax=Streptomyces capoamus TaxID=68183 RepID=A0A919BZN0_9ACTN|nr:hypothetical protein GCM10010501_10720 [Streptomyces libani subsp. rufus]GHG33757.1 hypothetical protein GCM10018980_02710 [Streptomyces capoamus]
MRPGAGAPVGRPTRGAVPVGEGHRAGIGQGAVVVREGAGPAPVVPYTGRPAAGKPP